MSFNHKEAVEICKKEEGFLGCYHPATVLAAIGLTRYLVRYDNRFASDRTRLLTEAVDATEIRPVPPATSYTNFKVSDKVDVYLNDAWRVGKVTRVVDPNYYVKLDCDGNEVHCGFYRVRIHLEWEDGKWAYRGYGNRTEGDNNQASASRNERT